MVAMLTVASMALGWQSKKSVHRLKQGLNSVKQSKTQAQKQLRVVKHQVKVVSGDIAAVEHRLGALEEQLDRTTQSLDGARQRQRLINAELGRAKIQMEKGRVQVAERLKQIYMRRQENFLTVLATSKNTGEIASRKFVLGRIASKDRQLFNSYARYRKEVEQKQNEQKAVVRQVAQLVSNQKRQQGDLEGVREEKKEILGSLRSKQNELRRLIAQFEADERAIESDIEAAMRRARNNSKRTGEPMKQFAGGRFLRPTNGHKSSNFGMRYHPILHKVRMHTGFDFGAPYGSAVIAAGEGVVISTSALRGYGNTVIIDHGGGIATVYAHLSRINVSAGSRVSRGQRIGAIGSSGLSTGPHLHFEVRKNGKPVNPGPYL